MEMSIMIRATAANTAAIMKGEILSIVLINAFVSKPIFRSPVLLSLVPASMMSAAIPKMIIIMMRPFSAPYLRTTGMIMLLVYFFVFFFGHFKYSVASQKGVDILIHYDTAAVYHIDIIAEALQIR